MLTGPDGATGPDGDDGPEGTSEPNGTVSVAWEVAEDPAFRRVVRRGEAPARPGDARSVHVVADGLRADREHFYRFRAGAAVSPVGRTRTAPAPGTRARSLRLGVVSCQNLEGGWWTALEALAADRLDLVLHLGDAIYEGDPGGSVPERRHVAPERPGGCRTLADYRARWRQYRQDPALQAALASAPWMLVDDDHEIVNNVAGGAADADLDRRAAAYRAMWEFLPVRTRPEGPAWRLHRRLDWGRLARISLLDTRQFRTAQQRGPDGTTVGPPELGDRPGDLLGADQEQWLLDGLRGSPARWNVIAQQVVMAPVRILNPARLLGRDGPPEVVNLDQWDGYTRSRARVLAALAEARTPNPVVLSGDIHTAWVNELRHDGVTVARSSSPRRSARVSIPAWGRC